MNGSRHVCPFERCGKSFARRDHLDRHKLNHSSRRLRCSRCSSEFARKDLLSRHARRHEQKDAEAGGCGRGVLLTRKRVWDPQLGYTSKKKKKKEIRSLSSSSTASASSLSSLSYSIAGSITSTESSLESSLDSLSYPHATLQDYSWIFEEATGAPIVGTTDFESIDPLLNFDPSQYVSSSTDVSVLSAVPVNANYFPALLPSDNSASSNLLIISAETQERITSFVMTITSNTSAASQFRQASEFLQLESLQQCLTKFFTNFNATYSLIHSTTFNPNASNPILTLSMILIGASYCSKSIHQSAVILHDHLRGALLSSEHFSANPEIWVLQSLLLIEVFGTKRAGLNQYRTSLLFHNLLTNLLKNCGYLSVCIASYSVEEENDLDQSWMKWVQLESIKRLTFFTFLWDVQNAMLFDQTLCINPFELNLQLPSDFNLWNSISAKDWIIHRRLESRPSSFPSALKEFLNCSNILPNLNSLCRVLILHGLIGVAIDMSKREAFITDCEQPKWKLKMNRAYDHWKQDFDKFSRNLMLKISGKESIQNKKRFVKFLTTNNTIYYTARLLLWTNFDDVQMFAAASRGSPQYYHARDRIVKWVSQVGVSDQAVISAAQLLRSGLTNLENWQVDGTFHYPWCLYIAVLTCWSFFTILQKDHEVYQSDILDKKTSMRKFLSLVTNETENLRNLQVTAEPHIKNIIDEISAHLFTVRWAVVYEAAKVLKKLGKDYTA